MTSCRARGPIATTNSAPQSHGSASGDATVALPAPLLDHRGSIQSLVEGAFQTVQLIRSVRGTVRANHYHLLDSHYLYVLEGSMKYYFRQKGDTGPPGCAVVTRGQMVHTPALTEHAIEFIEDTVCINIATQPRDRDSYEADVIRVRLIDGASAG